MVVAEVKVHGCYVHSFVDALVVKGISHDYVEAKKVLSLDFTRNEPVDDVRFSDCVCWCGWGKTIETGIETWAPRFRNIRYADCDILSSQASSLNVSAGGPAVIEDVVFENIRVEMQADTQTAVLQTSDGQHYEEPHAKTFPALVAIDNARYGPDSEDPVGRVRNCTFRNVSVSAEPGVPPADDPSALPISARGEPSRILQSGVRALLRERKHRKLERFRHSREHPDHNQVIQHFRTATISLLRIFQFPQPVFLPRL